MLSNEYNLLYCNVIKVITVNYTYGKNKTTKAYFVPVFFFLQNIAGKHSDFIDAKLLWDFRKMHVNFFHSFL